MAEEGTRCSQALFLKGYRKNCQHPHNTTIYNNYTYYELYYRTHSVVLTDCVKCILVV